MYKIINDKRPSRALLHVLCLAAMAILFGLPQEGHGQKKTTRKETKKMEHANGAFDVKTLPQKTDNPEAESAKLGRMSLDKQFHGLLEATSKGEMIYIGTDVEGSGGYVAIERITGKLGGKSGSFALLHVGIMTRGAPDLTVTVLPDSGTGELVGLTGKMNIKIESGGKHFYEFDYELP
jgi:hypothetical protein